MDNPDTESEQDTTGRTKRVGKLEDRIAESRHLRKLTRDPDLVAVTIEKIRVRTTVGLYSFLALGLGFTTTGVQKFLAAGYTPADPMWWGAWTVEPMLAGLLIVLLNFESTILAYGIDPDSVWLTRMKMILLTATLFMNLAPPLTPLWGGDGEFHLGSAVIHALVPLVIYGLAEVLPVVQARLHTVVMQAYAQADQHTLATESTASEPAPTGMSEVETPSTTSESVATEPVPERQPHPVQPTPQTAPEPTPQPDPLATVRRAPKLPDRMLNAVQQRRRELLAEGREMTTKDIQHVVKVPDSLAEQLLADLTATNGHALT